MTKNYCDLCGQEIKPNTLQGGIMRNTESFPVVAMTDPRGRPMQGVQRKVLPEVLDLCEDCQKKIWEYADKLKAEIEKQASQRRKAESK